VLLKLKGNYGVNLMKTEQRNLAFLRLELWTEAVGRILEVLIVLHTPLSKVGIHNKR